MIENGRTGSLANKEQCTYEISLPLSKSLDVLGSQVRSAHIGCDSLLSFLNHEGKTR
jgi:hypothetical protein